MEYFGFITIIIQTNLSNTTQYIKCVWTSTLDARLHYLYLDPFKVLYDHVLLELRLVVFV